MKTIKEKVERYLSDLSEFGAVLAHEPASALPLILRERFELFSVQLFGRCWLLAMESEDWDAGTPSEYRELSRKLANALDKPVVLVLAALSSSNRNRLVRMNVPFVVPESQVFLPVSLINLRETYPRQDAREGKPLSPTAQAMVLHQIIKGGLETLSSKQIAGALGYSQMGISKARSELETNGLCEVVRKGKELQLRFDLSARELWTRAGRLLRSPVQKGHWIRWDQPVESAKCAGVSALSQRSNLADDPIPSFALKKADFQHLLEQGVLHGCADRHEANARIESWGYDPALLTDETAVDALSLYLSLRENPDERVQSELAAMMEAFPWR